jgi:hypothetical protein
MSRTPPKRPTLLYERRQVNMGQLKEFSAASIPTLEVDSIALRIARSSLGR